LIAAVPYRLHTVLTDNGIQFADLPKNRDGWTARYRVHRFDQICRTNGIEHRLTKPNHPWTNGQVERMNRTLKEATVNRYHYDTHEQLRAHLADFVTAYNFARRLKILKRLSPYEYICNAGQKSQLASSSTRSSKCRDQTPSLENSRCFGVIKSLRPIGVAAEDAEFGFFSAGDVSLDQHGQRYAGAVVIWQIAPALGHDAAAVR